MFLEIVLFGILCPVIAFLVLTKITFKNAPRRMDRKYRNLLNKQYEALMKDLDVSDIQDRLYEKGYFSDKEYEEISSSNKSNRIERTKELLNSLLQNGTNMKYEMFVESLVKDYNWLWMKFKVDDTETEMNESFEDSLSMGDVPRPPDHLVRREALESIIVEKLKHLTRHKIIALHGMSGSGKTCVAISVLRNHPQLITESFRGVVFWHNLGNCKTDDDIIAQQTKLLKKTSSVIGHTLYMNTSVSMSSIASTRDSLSVSTIDLSTEELKDQLKMQFAEEPLKEALLVLDEVNDKKLLKAFDIGCKILVITRDTNVVTNTQTQIIEIENSLKKEESLQVFASFLDEHKVSNLPRQAKKLIEACKGNPFRIALIGAQLAENKEKLKDDPKYWNYFVNNFEKKEFFNLFLRTPDNPMKTIEVCVNSLDDNILPLYKMLAILPDNVKVSAEVLSKLWNKPIESVQSIMQELKKKSLIITTYDRETKNYMYEVHDLIMNYIRTCVTEDEKKKLHDKLLNSYNYNNIEVPVDIVDDRYIAYYVGYHIYQTANFHNKWNLFKELFLNLTFLGNKVRLTGPADVIHDLQEYEARIVSDELEMSLLQNIKAFLMTHGADLYRFQCTDIVQSILQHETKGILCSKASEIAHNNCLKNELYFDFLHEEDVDEIKHSTIDVREVITCVCFLWDYVLIGTQNGAVKFYHNPTNKLKKEYADVDASGGFAVKWIGVSVTKNYAVVAALYSNGTIKLWHIDESEYNDVEDVIEEEPEEVHNNNVPCNVTIRPDGTVLNCRWSANEEFLIAHTAQQVIIYTTSGDVRCLIDNIDSNSYIVDCVPLYNDRYVAVATFGTKQGLEVIEIATKQKISKITEKDLTKDTVKGILALPSANKLLILTSSTVTQYSLKTKENGSTLESKLILNSKDIKPKLRFLSFAVNKAGNLLFVSTDDGRVLCVDLMTNTHVFDLENKRGNVVAMAVSEVVAWDEFEAGYDVLLTGSGELETTAKVWHLDTAFISQAAHRNGKVRLTKRFDVSFLNTGSPMTPTTPSYSGKDSITSTPKRHQSFNNPRDIPKKTVHNTLSLDRLSLKPLNLKGIGNNNESGVQPLLAVIDDENNIQVMRDKKVLTKISENTDDPITTVKITPCNQHVIYGQRSGSIKKYTIRTKETITIMHVYSPIQYMAFVNPNMLIAAGENRCIIAYKWLDSGEWNSYMLQHGNTYLGSQELLNDIHGLNKRHADSISTKSYESIDHRDRTFTNDRKGTLCKPSGLVECFWISDIGVITVENNGCVKLWNKQLKLECVLRPRRDDARVACAICRNLVLVLCDDRQFQIFRINASESQPKLELIQDTTLNGMIGCCDLTSDGNLLALGLDTGNVVIWNVKKRQQLSNGFLRHHKHEVRSCSFSPVPDKLYKSAGSGTPHLPNREALEECQPPLVLVTMATDVVFWNITAIIRQGRGVRQHVNPLTPIPSPLDNRAEANCSHSRTQNFFFSEGLINHNCWKELWKGKTCKQGSKRKEILACIKLSGVHAKALRHDECFSCFVTVDNTGYVHIMNIMKS